jgi:hypothetical protein
LIIDDNAQTICLNLVDQSDLPTPLTSVSVLDNIGAGFIHRHSDRIHGSISQSGLSGRLTHKFADASEIFKVTLNCKLLAALVHKYLRLAIV